jgi:hypothetical protein
VCVPLSHLGRRKQARAFLPCVLHNQQVVSSVINDNWINELCMLRTPTAACGTIHWQNQNGLVFTFRWWVHLISLDKLALKKLFEKMYTGNWPTLLKVISPISNMVHFKFIICNFWRCLHWLVKFIIEHSMFIKYETCLRWHLSEYQGRDPS